MREAEEAAQQQRLREEAERAEAEEQQRQEEARRDRQAKVTTFLKTKGFKSVTAPKRSMMKTTYPIISAAEAGSGLVPPAVATHMFGKAGSVMMTVMLFMAITSTGSAEGIAVSSLVAYDIYKT